MLISNLRKVGGSTMFAIPPEVVKMLGLKVGDPVSVSVENGRLIASPQRPSYTLDQLLAESDYAEPLSADQREWVDAPAVGGEPL